MMMSSIDLFFSRDCAGGAGPAVDAPRFAFLAPVSSAVAAAAGWVGACETSDGAAGFTKLLKRLEVDVGADVFMASEVVAGALSGDFARLENKLLEGALVEGADIPELLGGLLKKPKVLGAAVGDDTGSVAED